MDAGRRGFPATLLCAPAFISRVSRGDEADLSLGRIHGGREIVILSRDRFCIRRGRVRDDILGLG